MDMATVWQSIVQFVIKNWYWIIPLIITEAMPFLPGRSNGIAQAALNIFGKIKAGPVALLLLALALSGCPATTQQMVDIEMGIRQGKITMATGADVACKAGLVMTPENCAQALVAYQASQMASNIAMQAMLANAKDPAIREQLEKALSQGFPQFTFAP